MHSGKVLRTICFLCEQRLLMLRLSQSNMNLAIIFSQLLCLWVARRRQMRWWVRRWISLRPEKGAYGNLMMLSRNEDVVAFRNFTALSPQMFLDLVEWLTPRLRKEDTWYRDSLKVGLKVVITLWYLATGDNYKSLMYLFYVPHRTISILVQDDCQAARPFGMSIAMRWSATLRQQKGGRRLLQATPANVLGA